MPLADMFWGDRYGQVDDPFGHRWSIATHKRDMTPQQMQEDMHEDDAAKRRPRRSARSAAMKFMVIVKARRLRSRRHAEPKAA
jgi:hypothetical protein